jgi:hypothetical protein
MLTKVKAFIVHLIRVVVLVVVVMPMATATVQGCGDDEEPYCFDWPDVTRSDIDPNKCPSQSEAQSRYVVPEYELVDSGTLENGKCCYPAVFVGSDSGCVTHSGAFGVSPKGDAKGD